MSQCNHGCWGAAFHSAPLHDLPLPRPSPHDAQHEQRDRWVRMPLGQDAVALFSPWHSHTTRDSEQSACRRTFSEQGREKSTPARWRLWCCAVVLCCAVVSQRERLAAERAFAALLVGVGSLVRGNGALAAETHRANGASVRLLARVVPLVRDNLALAHPHQQVKPPLAPPQMNLKRRRACVQ